MWGKDVDIGQCPCSIYMLTWFHLKIKWWCTEMLFWIQKLY